LAHLSLAFVITAELLHTTEAGELSLTGHCGSQGRPNQPYYLINVLHPEEIILIRLIAQLGRLESNLARTDFS